MELMVSLPLNPSPRTVLGLCAGITIQSGKLLSLDTVVNIVVSETAIPDSEVQYFLRKIVIRAESDFLGFLQSYQNSPQVCS